MNQCDHSELAAVFVAGDLGPDEAIAYAEHAAGCETCRQELAQASIGHAVLQVHVPELFDARANEVPRAVTPRPGEASRPPQREAANNRRWLGVAAVAAVALLAVGVPWAKRQTGDSQPSRIVELGDGGARSDAAPPRLRLSLARPEGLVPLPPGELETSDQLVVASDPGVELLVVDEGGHVPLVPHGSARTPSRLLVPGTVTVVALDLSAQPFDANLLLTGDTDAVLEGRIHTREDLSIAGP